MNQTWIFRETVETRNYITIVCLQISAIKFILGSTGRARGLAEFGVGIFRRYAWLIYHSIGLMKTAFVSTWQRSLLPCCKYRGRKEQLAGGSWLQKFSTPIDQTSFSDGSALDTYLGGAHFESQSDISQSWFPAFLPVKCRYSSWNSLCN